MILKKLPIQKHPIQGGNNMKMKFFALALSLMLMVTGAAMADNYYDAYTNLPADSLEQAKAAVMAQLPQAVIDHAQLDYDDRRFEWDIFYTLNASVLEEIMLWITDLKGE